MGWRVQFPVDVDFTALDDVFRCHLGATHRRIRVPDSHPVGALVESIHGGAKLGWFLVVLFFSSLGLAVFLMLPRLPGISQTLRAVIPSLKVEKTTSSNSPMFIWVGYIYTPEPLV
jgi:hypothetical protein